VGWGTTNTNGSFTITTELIPQNAQNVRAFPILYSWGPQRFNEVIKVSDPTPSISTWKNPRDSTIWFMGRAGGGYENVTPGDTCNFGDCYAETLTSVIRQPHSGAVNILATYIHARTFTNPAPTRVLRCMWEPGYTVDTKIHGDPLDSVVFNGDTNYTYGSDEWDDYVLLHEYGHYIMDHYANIPPTDTGLHAWNYSFPDQPGIGYGEGWAHFFPARVLCDTMLIDTKEGIGNGAIYIWYNIEDPWISSDFLPQNFDGGPWCEGAVAGSIWDLYDTYIESPYDSYPAPGFPDTALYDSVSISFDSLFQIFDDYDPPDTASFCYTIFDFRAGWNCYEYGQEGRVDTILLHHRIKDDLPAKPTGLSAQLENYKVRLYWNKNSEGDLKSYRIYRKEKQTFGIGQWSDWSMIDDLDGPNDTTYLDVNVSQMWTYRYRITAYDTLSNESGYSDSVQIDIPQKKIDGPPPLNLGCNIVRDIDDIQLIISPNVHKIVVKLYDCCGRLIHNNKLQLQNNQITTVQFDIKGKLAAGVYFLVIDINNTDQMIEKLVIIQ